MLSQGSHKTPLATVPEEVTVIFSSPEGRGGSILGNNSSGNPAGFI